MSDRKRKRNKPQPLAAGACLLCKSVEDDEFKFGKFYKVQNISVHYYCVLFASGLPQNGRSSREGVEGFLVRDIITESNRGGRLRCSYCSHVGATVGCFIKKCKRVFHLPCGQKHGALTQFFGQFRSYCSEHKPEQCIKESEIGDETVCTICYSPIELENRDSFLKAPCCISNWFHRKCIQMYALSAGYFFKCTLCNDKEEFEKEMFHYGIYIPKQDASWEKERNAYQELLVRAKCDASPCNCPKGRQENKEASLWHLLYCEDCGSTARHVGCETPSLKKKLIWKCSDCTEFNNKLIDKRKKEQKLNPCIAEAGTSAGRNQSSKQKRANKKALQKLLGQCKDCVVQLTKLKYEDLPSNVRHKYKTRLKHLREESRNERHKQATRKSSRMSSSRALEQGTPVTKNQKANPKSPTKKLATKSSRSVKSSTQSKNKLGIAAAESNDKKTAKQMLINGFFKDRQGNTLGDRNNKIELSLENEAIQNEMKQQVNTSCMLQQVQETMMSTSMTSIQNVTNKDTFVTSNNYVLVKVTKTVNFYCKEIQNFFQAKEIHSPEKMPSSSMNSIVKEKCFESDFKEVMQNFMPPMPMVRNNISISEIENTSVNDEAKQEMTPVMKIAVNKRSLSSIIKKKCISKNIYLSSQTSKMSTIKTYLHSALGAYSGKPTPRKHHVYIDLNQISGIRVTDKDLFSRGVQSTLSVVLDDCFKKCSRTISCINTTPVFLPNHNNFFNSGRVQQQNHSIALREQTFKPFSNVQEVVHQDSESTSETNVSAYKVHHKTVCVKSKTGSIQPLLIKLEPADFMDKVAHNKISSISVAKSEHSVFQPNHIFSLPIPTVKYGRPIAVSSLTQAQPTTPMLAFRQKIMENVTNTLKGNQASSNSSSPVICEKENPKNACIEKYLHVTGSCPKPSTTNEKRKKRLRFKSEHSDRKGMQSNTLLSYFFTL